MQIRGSEISCIDCGRRAAHLHDDMRAHWYTAMPRALEARVEAEAARWDDWAKAPQGQTLRAGTVGDWLAASRVYQPLLAAYPDLVDLSGKRILDIGGTCLDAAKFLRSGAARIDQVEVSPTSQRTAMENLENSGVDWRGRVWFHTTPAEHLPFAEGTFDIVFSRSTIHHTDRSLTMPMIARVLSRGGIIFIIESYRSPLLYRLTYWKRRVSGVDRGTDNPFARGEIEELNRTFADLRVGYFGALWTIWSQTGDKLSQKQRRVIWNIDLKLGTVAGRLLGSQLWLVGRKGSLSR